MVTIATHDQALRARGVERGAASVAAPKTGRPDYFGMLWKGADDPNQERNRPKDERRPFMNGGPEVFGGPDAPSHPIV